MGDKAKQNDTIQVIKPIVPDMTDEKPKKKSAAPAPAKSSGGSQWGRPAGASTVQRFEAKEPQPAAQQTQAAAQQAPAAPQQTQSAAQQPAAPAQSAAPAQPAQAAPRPAGQQQAAAAAQMFGQVRAGAMSNLYSDNGRTVCMVLKFVSYVLFVLAPVAFLRSLLSMMTVTSYGVSGAQVFSYILDGLIAAAGYVVAGFLVIAVIKILQNLIAISRK